jgi:hypothetical protein
LTSAHGRAIAWTHAGLVRGTRSGEPTESAAGAGETSKAVKDLVDLSEQLTRAITRFKIESTDR